MWTFTSDECGYMLFKDGKPQRGVRTRGTRTHTEDGKRRAWQHVRGDFKRYREEAQKECDRLNSKDGGKES